MKIVPKATCAWIEIRMLLLELNKIKVLTSKL